MNKSYPFRHVPIPLDTGAFGHVFAGPTRALLPGFKLIRCAAEIPVDPAKVAFDVSTADFQPFDDTAVLTALPDILAALERGEALYVGCMGGTGRTGTMLALMVAQHPAFTGEAAIAYVRQVYKSGAVETKEQEKQVARLAGKAIKAAPYLDVVDGEFPGIDDVPIKEELHLGAKLKKVWKALWGG